MTEEDGGKKRFVPRGRNLAWALAALGAVLCVVLLGYALRGGRPAPEPQAHGPEVRVQAAPPPQAQPAANATVGPAEAANATAPDAAEGGYQGFEETLGVPLERVVRQIDYALVETLLLTGYDPHAIAIAEVEARTWHDETYHFQRLHVTLDEEPDRFIETLRGTLGKWAPEAGLRTDKDAWTVSVLGAETHALEFAAVEPEPAARAAGELAVVIDDLGRSVSFADALAALPFPVTFSVLPHQPHSREVAALAVKASREVLVHLPMEPKGYPAVNPGPGALFTAMTPDDLRRALVADLDEVPGAHGANNHMGSKFTQTGPAMAVVMKELRRRSMFFLDSLTAPRSTGVDQARAAGVAVYRRSVFLDNIRDTDAIVRQLEKAERIASTSGQAVAIGHPYPETLAALRRWGRARGTSARVVPVGTLNPENKQRKPQ